MVPRSTAVVVTQFTFCFFPPKSRAHSLPKSRTVENVLLLNEDKGGEAKILRVGDIHLVGLMLAATHSRAVLRLRAVNPGLPSLNLERHFFILKNVKAARISN